ncbi:N-acylglucosamine 2-epimerase [Brevundimonas sp. Leaf363]|uniref:AGE family epimerase/isomerase n=1 Tax=Brevundimonas sp. Leaf363 TaxID=1736353 RepID=UPI000701F70C|nr:AGE family epimerase/isomerase [Brevundimonas sp. Leaf363]KQS57198.1 N-acylglucosamine 2-epimerase [Brevundimonas sp. Leaf363]
MSFLHDARAKVRSWLFDHALPLWAERGADADGRFYELLEFDGRPVTGGVRRTRVQARQVYLFAEAADLGFEPGRAIARKGLDNMIRTCRRPDGLWVLSTDGNGAVLDDTPDLYDQAFCLFALAAGHRLLGDDRCLPLALQTLDAIETVMAAPHGGWAEAAPARLPRRQNPHMHLLEAMLAWHAATPEPRFEQIAREILGLFDTAFFHEPTGTLSEFFTEDWRLADGQAGEIVEPGHEFEWVWLLSEARKNGWIDAEARAMRLYDHAGTAGLNAEGFPVREMARGGGPVDPGWRLWAETEALRAHLTVGDEARAAAMVDRIFDSHLATDVPGLWVDSYDAAGIQIDTTVPASSFYHVMTAFTVLLRGAE